MTSQPTRRCTTILVPDLPRWQSYRAFTYSGFQGPPSDDVLLTIDGQLSTERRLSLQRKQLTPTLTRTTTPTFDGPLLGGLVNRYFDTGPCFRIIPHASGRKEVYMAWQMYFGMQPVTLQ